VPLALYSFNVNVTLTDSTVVLDSLSAEKETSWQPSKYPNIGACASPKLTDPSGAGRVVVVTAGAVVVGDFAAMVVVGNGKVVVGGGSVVVDAVVVVVVVVALTTLAFSTAAL
jgi:hypothetical protein